MTLLAALQSSPDAAVAVCTVGTLLIYFEFNRPGLVVPGALGLLLVLLAIAGLWNQGVDAAAVACLMVSAALLAIGLRRKTPFVLGIVATVGISLGFSQLVQGAGDRRVHLTTALLAGFFLGPGTFLLTGIARRARVNKGLD